MSTQSAQLRTASQATVNNYRPKVSDASAPERSKRVNPVWLPVLAVSTWVELAYLVPALADWLGNITV